MSEGNLSAIWKSALLTLIFFYFFISFDILRPTSTAWLIYGDSAQHFLGWSFFRNEPWSNPIALLSSYLYPNGTTIIHTDSIPVLAVFFRSMESFLPRPFQYFGIWLFSCYFLLSFFGYKILQRLSLPEPARLLGVGFLLFSPTLHNRHFHLALCAHWLFLAIFERYLMTVQDTEMQIPYISIVLLNLFAAWTHPYLLLATLVLSASLYLAVLPRANNRERLKIAAFTVIGMEILLSALAGLGYFFQEKTAYPDYYLFALDLLSFFNPLDHSRIVPSLAGGQFESYTYLGLPMIVGLFYMLYLLFISRDRNKWRLELTGDLPNLRPLILCCVGLAVFSLSPVIHILGKRLITFDLLENSLRNFYGTFRSVARYIWPLFYFLYLGIFTLVWRRISNKKVALTLMTAALIFHVFEMKSLFFIAPTAKGAYSSATLPRLEPYLGKVKHLTFHPSYQSFGDCLHTQLNLQTFYQFALLAANRRWTIDGGDTSRVDREFWGAYCRLKMGNFRNEGIKDPETLYILDAQMQRVPIILQQLRTRPSVIECSAYRDSLACLRIF